MALGDHHVAMEETTSGRQGRWALLALIVLLYVLATWLTGPHFVGDSAFYAFSIVAHDQGRASPFWDFGHLLWRPLGLVLYRSFRGIVPGWFDPDAPRGIEFLLACVSWLSGLVCVVALFLMLRRHRPSLWVAVLVGLGFLFSHTFLNYAKTGNSYIPGLALLFLGIVFLTGESADQRRSDAAAALAGVSLGGAVLAWFVYILAIPAVLLAPLLLSGVTRSQFRKVLVAGVAFAVATLVPYAAVVSHLGIHDLDGLRAWVASAAHGSTHIEGPARMIFGFARSFVSMGDDGVLFKRFLLKDPYNPVSVFELLGASVLKLALFYGALALLLLHLFFQAERGRRAAAFVLAGGLPVLGFAVFWQGGDLERYLPLYPFLFFAVAFSLAGLGKGFGAKVVVSAFLILCVFVNGVALSQASLREKRELFSARLVGLEPLLKLSSRVFVLPKDPVEGSDVFPFHPIYREGKLRAYRIVNLGLADTPRWRKTFAERVLAVWRNGGEVWLTKRVLQPRPEASWGWAEGDDKRVSWADFPQFFSQLEFGDRVGGDDGFLRVLPSTKNQALLQGLVKGRVE
jgi:hypothetical protein